VIGHRPGDRPSRSAMPRLMSGTRSRSWRPSRRCSDGATETGRDLPAQRRSVAAAGGRDAGAVPQAQAAEDLPLRLLALAGARLGWAEPGARARRVADRAD